MKVIEIALKRYKSKSAHLLYAIYFFVCLNMSNINEVYNNLLNCNVEQDCKILLRFNIEQDYKIQNKSETKLYDVNNQVDQQF